MSLRDSALYLAERGFRIFPIVPRGTMPACKFSTESTDDPETVAKIWRSDRSRKNIGVHTGDGLMVLDIDPEHGGNKSIVALLTEHGPLPDTFAVTTPSGGMHFYFETDKDVRNSASKIAPGVDIRGHNGFVVGPGSIRDERTKDDGTIKAGGVYTAVNDLLPADCPEWLETLALADSTSQASSDAPDSDEPLEDVPLGARNDRLFKEAAGLRGKGWKPDAIRQAITARNATFTNPLPSDEVALIVSQASKYKPNALSPHDTVYRQSTKKARPTRTGKPRHPDEAPGAASEGERRDISLRKLNTYSKKKVHFLWRGLFPLASVSIIAGDPGQAKTSFMLNIAAHLTHGGTPLKGGPGMPKGSVVFATAEDSIDHTVYPRVDAAGGDADKFYIVDNVDFDVLADYDMMRAELEKIGDVRLMIIDPVTAYMSKDADGNSNTDVRVTLRTLADLAEEFNMAVVGISHLNKDTRKSVFARLLGSVGWVAAPRAVYLVNENPDTPGQSVAACAKTNFEEPEPVAFTKQSVDVDTEEGPASQIVTQLEEYEGGLSIDELFAGNNKKMSKVDTAQHWLQERLQLGEWAEVSALKLEVEQTQPFSWRTVESAKKRLDIETHKAPPPGGWSWRMEPVALPMKDDKILSLVTPQE